MKKGLFLDRDGVINIEKGYVHKIKDCIFIPEIFDVCKCAQENLFKIIIVTNQAGIGRGFYTEKEFHLLMKYILDKFLSFGININDYFFCPHHPSEGIKNYKKDCLYRKPNPGMINSACRKHDIDPNLSIMIGDKQSDKEASEQAGIKKFVDSNNSLWHIKAMNLILENNL